jgi:hypothetical protein
MDKLLTELRIDYPAVNFRRGAVFSWNSKQQTVIIPRRTADLDETRAIWSLLHEVGHATLQHQNYISDVELIRLEAAAWQQAERLGQTYGQNIDPDHVQDCLDSYRDWLHQRSTCPTCGTISLQIDDQHYRCYNCNANWGVSRSRLCRPYRRLSIEAQQVGN